MTSVFSAAPTPPGPLGTLDPRDRLTVWTDALGTWDFAAGAEVYLDGFTDFTPRESRVSTSFLRGRVVTVA
jgi:ATP-dependent helicase/DNAse subunit B